MALRQFRATIYTCSGHHTERRVRNEWWNKCKRVRRCRWWYRILMTLRWYPSYCNRAICKHLPVDQGYWLAPYRRQVVTTGWSWYLYQWVVHWQHRQLAENAHPPSILIPCNFNTPISFDIGGKIISISPASFNLGPISPGSNTCIVWFPQNIYTAWDVGSHCLWIPLIINSCIIVSHDQQVPTCKCV